MSKTVTVTQSLKEHEAELESVKQRGKKQGQNEIIDILSAFAVGKSYNFTSFEDTKFRREDLQFLAKNVVENHKFKETLKKELQDIVSNAIIEVETSRIKTRAKLNSKLSKDDFKLNSRLYDRDCGKQEALEDLRTLLTGKGLI